MRAFGKMERVPVGDKAFWVLTEVEAHVVIRLKAIFSRIPKSRVGQFTIQATDENSNDLEWFESRYSLKMSDEDRRMLKRQAKAHRQLQASVALIMDASYMPPSFKINGELRDYQARAVDLFLTTKRLLNGDAVGLGKTLEAIGAWSDPRTLPALVVVQAHLTKQWAAQVIKFLGCRVHIVKGTKPYPLPQAEVYITTYSRITGWVDVFSQFGFKSVVLDEVQEVRRTESLKHQSCAAVAASTEYCLGLSATPIYNMGDEIHAIYNVIKPGALGTRDDFIREWCGFSNQVKDPKALGSYLREQFLFLRRTRADVGRELPPVNKIVHDVDYDDEAVESVLDVAQALAVRATTGSFMERGQAGRELDMLLRMVTGVSKAKYVAEYVRILLENDEPVLLLGWHRDVYDIWLKELAEFNPVMFTGTESIAHKEETKRRFISGQSNLLIMSLRSGIGLDGLQERCRYVVFGELDWSPAVHEQATGRVDRDGQKDQVTSIYLVSNGGSDPLLVDLLGIKSSQAAGIIDPLGAQSKVHSDSSRIKELAEYVLKKRRSGGDIKPKQVTQADEMCSTNPAEAQVNLFEEGSCVT